MLVRKIATDGKDGNGLKLEKIGPIFSSFDAMSPKIPKIYTPYSMVLQIIRADILRVA